VDLLTQGPAHKCEERAELASSSLLCMHVGISRLTGGACSARLKGVRRREGLQSLRVSSAGECERV